VKMPIESKLNKLDEYYSISGTDESTIIEINRRKTFKK